MLLTMVMSREEFSWGLRREGEEWTVLFFLSHAVPFSALDPVSFVLFEIQAN